MQEDGRVGLVLIEQDGGALQGQERVAVLHQACRAHGINLVSGREDQGETGEGITLVVIYDSARDIQGIGGIGVQVALESHFHRLALDHRLGFLFQGRGEEDVVGILDLYIFVKGETDNGLVHRHADGARQGSHPAQRGRNGVLGAAGRRRGGIGTAPGKDHGPQHEGGRNQGQQLLQVHSSLLETFSRPSMADNSRIILSRISRDVTYMSI